jgi:hypothetical protein
MKYFVIVGLFLISVATFSQTKVNEMNVADSVLKTNQWDTQKQANGTLMFLDVPYKRDGQDSTEDLTLTVAKDKMHKRPAFISIIVSNNVEKANGVFLKFSKTYKDENGKPQINMERDDPVRVPFEKCNDELKICTARISGGYIEDAESGEKHDIFQKFMEFDHVYFLLVYQDGSHKSVAVSLDSFKEQYKAIADSDTPERHE